MNNIQTLNDKLVNFSDKDYPLGIFSGKMGLCIYFYYLSRWEKNEKYKYIADKYLDDIFEQSANYSDITVEYGLSGIGLGISILIKENFIEGNINEILEDIDSIIFKRIAFLDYQKVQKRISKTDLLYLLYYLYTRFTDCKYSDNQYIFQELIIKVIEMLNEDMPSDFFNDYFSFSIQNFHLPIFLYVIRKIYDLGIYNNRIIKILEEHSQKILSTYPVSTANKIYYLCGLVNIKPCLPRFQKELELLIKQIIKNIDMEYMFNSEFKEQDIFLENGLSMVYLLLLYLKNEYPEYCIEYTPSSFLDRLQSSTAWTTLLDSKFYFRYNSQFMAGFPGTYLVMSYIKKQLS